jgi:hypothetical protein
MKYKEYTICFQFFNVIKTNKLYVVYLTFEKIDSWSFMG